MWCATSLCVYRYTRPFWNCSSDYGSKCFSLKNTSRWYFFYFKKIIFDISASKWSKNTKKLLILNKTNSKILEMRVGPRFQTGPVYAPPLQLVWWELYVLRDFYPLMPWWLIFLILIRISYPLLPSNVKSLMAYRRNWKYQPNHCIYIGHLR